MPAIFESVIDIWLIWAAALLILALCCRRLIGRMHIANLRKFHCCEEGASYALPYVLTFPIFVLLMAVFVQASLILICKIGTVYSAYSAARTYIVWQSAGSHHPDGSNKFGFAKFKACRAASLAMVPFASSNPQHLKDMYPTFPLVIGSDGVGGNFVFSTFALGLLVNIDRPRYSQMYNRLLNNANQKDTGTVHQVIKDRAQGASDDYIDNKFKFAVASTRVQCSASDNLAKWNEDVTFTIRYRMPFQVPGTARILGGSSMKPWWYFGPTTYYRDIESNVTMPSEAAKTPNGNVGIPYQPSRILELLNQ
jgi:hypothetical protein